MSRNRNKQKDVRSRTLLIISTIAVSTSAIFAIIFFQQASETQGALEAIAKALEEGNLRQALSILFDPQQIVQVGGN